MKYGVAVDKKSSSVQVDSLDLPQNLDFSENSSIEKPFHITSYSRDEIEPYLACKLDQSLQAVLMSKLNVSETCFSL